MKKLMAVLFALMLSVGMAVAQDPAPAGTPDNQGTVSTPPPDQSTQPADDGTATDTPAADTSATDSAAQDPAADTSADAAGTDAATQDTGDAAALPQTASPLPFLGLLGAGMMVGGSLLRRRR
jgi:LPXTG-motif cell wall-anchored protein